MEGINAEDSLGRRGSRLGEVERGEAGDNLLRLQRDGDDLADEAEDVVVVVGAVGVVDDGLADESDCWVVGTSGVVWIAAVGNGRLWAGDCRVQRREAGSDGADGDAGGFECGGAVDCVVDGERVCGERVGLGSTAAKARS
jgi:hypothetical protein